MQRVLAVLLVAVSAFLLFWRLDADSLWRDEGTTAVWARQLAQSGTLLPYVYDFDKQQLLVQAADGHDVNSRLLPAMHSYLQFYVVAASFKLLGVNTWTARAPLALVGALLLLVLWRVGVRLYGAGSPLALAPPGLAVTSIFFLNAARQSRYYMLVAFFAGLVLYEAVRYIHDRDLIDSKAFWGRLAAWGLLLYFSNYLSFLGAWASLGVFVLLERNLDLFKRFAAVSAAMAVIVLTDFSLLHAEFAGSWPPPRPQPIWEVYQGALSNRVRDFWRAFPLVLLVPLGSWLFLGRSAGMRASTLVKVGFGAASLLTLAPLLLFSSGDARGWSTPFFWTGFTLCLAVPALFLWAQRRIAQPDPLLRSALLGAVMLVLSPLITIGLAKDQASLRHCYQIVPAGVLLSAAALGAVSRRKGGAWAAALFVPMAAWPNIDSMVGGTDEVVQRQFLADDSYNGPLLHFFAENVEPGDSVAFVRNVKGMPVYFYFPEIRWVGLLDEAAPHNAQFQGRIPADQFKQGADPDWWVVYDRRDEPSPSLNDEAYELVWEHKYTQPRSWWDGGSRSGGRNYEVYKRRRPL